MFGGSSCLFEPALQGADVRQQLARLPLAHQHQGELSLLVHERCRSDIEEGQIPALTMAKRPHANAPPKCATQPGR